MEKKIKVQDAVVGQYYLTNNSDEVKIMSITLHEESFVTPEGYTYFVYSTELTMKGGYNLKLENDTDIYITEEY